MTSLAELGAWAGRPVYIAVGFFDGVHLGHRHLLARLRECAARHDAAAVALTFANSPRRFHQPQLPGHEWRYLTTPDEKLELLADTGLDATLMLPYDASVAAQTARGFLDGLAAHAPLAGLCVGFDTSIGCDMLSGRDRFGALCRDLGIDMTWVEPLKVGAAAVKSSRVRELVVDGDMRSAAELLGRRYTVCGPIVRGKGKGERLLAIPTANMHVPGEKLTPPAGIYAGIVDRGGKSYAAAVCLSTAQQHAHTVLESAAGQGAAAAAEPTTEPEGYVLEAHVIGYDGDLYGERLRVELVDRLRGWRDFGSADELAAQMRSDIRSASLIAYEVLDA